MKRRILLAGLTGLALTGSVVRTGAALAAPAPAIELSPAQKALLDGADAYLTSLKSVHGRFSQSDPQGAVTTGEIWLKRPGKARFQYDPPADLLVVSDGANVMIYDARLKTFDQYPLWSTPLGILLAKKVRLDKSVAVTAVRDTASGFVITARDRSAKAEGSITLTFSSSPLALTGWKVTDAQGQSTLVALSPLSETPNLDPRFFQLRDPRPIPKRPQN